MSASNPRIVVLGSINMDLITRTPSLPVPGETVLGSSFTTASGGKGGNQAIAAAKAGSTVSFIGAVGDDEFGETLRHTLTSAGVDDSALRTAAGPSGIATITVDDDAENSIVVVPGANGGVRRLTDDDRSTIADADILLCQLEIPLDTVVAAFEYARSRGVVTMLNPSPVQDLPDALLATTDVLVVNEAEEARLDHRADAVPHVITTLGARGARYRGPESFEVSAPRVEAVDTTGAGDAFAGALAASWPSGPRRAVEWACVAGAFAATRPGASASSGTRENIDALRDAAGS
ncbi:Ribokinase [Rhodococcus sp. AW25M09]|uniref:ribokinase n=1 Tax=Rhodococcus sp. AW25M09 TaxID=1268303 RepID=UPI0002ABB0FA|nr:ribokinase [Rhodococcus sp. AW25M09]CCQ15991.1 Ribokinase [Rhodococcus sp. AW25M09]